uniref:Vta1 domain-containing protein n=1 Tax=Angiostrongylus cantonensis TaxID=6313 RepID=A0A0K0CY45_ANGCA
MAAKIPASLKPIAHYIKIANENSNRDPVVYYWCLFYAAQNAMQLDKSSPEALHFLTGLLGTLESIKKQLVGTEAITNEVVAQAHLENYALKLFNFADAKEKAGQVDKSVVHAFYTAGHVMDVLSLFGEVGYSSVKYAKWKSTQIFSCLKDGKPYVASSQQSEVLHGDGGQLLPPSRIQPQVPTSNSGFGVLLGVPSSMFFFNKQTRGYSSKNDERKPSVEAFNEARKFTKYALSAMDYEDTRAVVDNLRKALALMERY